MRSITEEKMTAWQVLGSLIRVSIGLFFIYMGLKKAFDPVGFLKLVREYHLPIHYVLLNGIVAILPWFEVFCGLLLTFGVAVRGTALAMLLMLLPFTVVVIIRAMGIAAATHVSLCSVKFDCGCGAGEVLICWKVAENTALMAGSILLLAGLGRPWAASYGVFKPQSRGAPGNPAAN